MFQYDDILSASLNKQQNNRNSTVCELIASAREDELTDQCRKFNGPL